jgi:methylmalonyl-CoA mutase, C-terminal domain
MGCDFGYGWGFHAVQNRYKSGDLRAFSLLIRVLRALHGVFLGMSKELKRPVRVLVAKVGLDGHDRGAKVIAAALRDAGMEVIYTGLRQTPEMVVNAALQEDVDAIGISILSGAHMTVFPKVISLMKEKGMTDVLLTGGGIIPDDDMNQLNKIGVGKLFAPGTPTGEISEYIKEWVRSNRQ